MVGWCFGLLLAMVLLNCAVILLQQILPTLVVVLGVVGLVGIVVGVVLAVRWWLALKMAVARRLQGGGPERAALRWGSVESRGRVRLQAD